MEKSENLFEDVIADLVRGAGVLGITIDKEKIDKFGEYERLLIGWNKKINLVSFKERNEIYISHFLDSLWCVKGGEFSKGVKVIDIGSGAGFPGIPLKICFPWIVLFLLESQKKRCLFLKEIIRELGLKECIVVNSRAEEMAHQKEYRESFDIAVVRAVASLPVLLELSLPLLVPGGRMVALKGRNIENEVQLANHACQVLGGKLLEIIPYRVRDEEGRNVVVYEKVKKTPPGYPRRPGIPQKRPLVK